MAPDAGQSQTLVSACLRDLDKHTRVPEYEPSQFPDSLDLDIPYIVRGVEGLKKTRIEASGKTLQQLKFFEGTLRTAAHKLQREAQLCL